MAKRKISECINVRINVGNYQHIEIVKYAEEEIEYSNTKERIEKEDAIRDDVVANLLRSLKAIPEKLGKGIENAIEVEESIKKKIPEWLANGPVPNIANGAIGKEISVSATQQAQKDEVASYTKIDVEEPKKETKKEIKVSSKELEVEQVEQIEAPVSSAPLSGSLAELFEDDTVVPVVSSPIPVEVKEAVEEAVEEIREKIKKVKKEEKIEKSDDDLFGDDDDIFGEDK